MLSLDEIVAPVLPLCSPSLVVPVASISPSQAAATPSLFKKKLSYISVKNFRSTTWRCARILRPETYVHLNPRGDYSPKGTTFQAAIPLCSFRNKVIHFHLLTIICWQPVYDTNVSI